MGRGLVERDWEVVDIEVFMQSRRRTWSPATLVKWLKDSVLRIARAWGQGLGGYSHALSEDADEVAGAQQHYGAGVHSVTVQPDGTPLSPVGQVMPGYLTNSRSLSPVVTFSTQ